MSGLGRKWPTSKTTRLNLSKRFWAKTHIPENINECWIWRGSRNEKGYGQIRIAGRAFKAHRIAYELCMGRRAGQDLFVCHKCDNPPCVNPAHLFLGTASDNARDSADKGRQKNQKHPEMRPLGERHPMAKLDWATVRQVRALYADGGHSQPALSRRFGVSQSHIQRIVTGQNWRD